MSKSGAGKTENKFWQKMEIIWAIYRDEDGCKKMCECLITLLSISICDNPNRYMKYPTFNPCWSLTSIQRVMLHAFMAIKAKGS